VTTPTISSGDWPGYLDGPAHASYNAAATAITPASANGLTRRWQFLSGGGYLSSPAVADGAVFIGANNGWLYRLSETTGRLLNRIFLGTVDVTSCPPPPTGMVSTATVAIDPRTHQPTVYASGANGYLYALDAANLRVEWRSVIAIPSKTVNNFFDWSSPTVADGHIYLGVSSNCDSPLVRGGLLGFDQSNGRRLGEFYTVPKGWVGGSIWSSIAVASDGDVFATTGNGPETTGASQLVGQSESIIKLSSALRFLGRFQVPAGDEGFDTDFGASPVLFEKYVGACNKNGIFYALLQSTMKLAWKRQVSGPAGGNEECIAAPVWNGRDLFLATPAATVGTVSAEGTVQERTASGTLVWASGLPNAVDGSPSMDGAGVLAVGTFDSTGTPNATYLVAATNGKVLRTLNVGADFAQSAFAGRWLFTANDAGVFAWGAGPLSSRLHSSARERSPKPGAG
jgi:outer membrane protein assembly factor BamB